MLRAGKPWWPVVLWMGCIFAMSTSLGSAENTSRFIGPFLHWLLPHAPEETITRLHFLIRKAGHFTEYAILALLLLRAFRRSLPPGTAVAKALVFSLLVASGYAATDEFHQTFVRDRTPSPGDVLIDTAGAFVALAGAAAWRKWRRPPPEKVLQSGQRASN